MINLHNAMFGSIFVLIFKIHSLALTLYSKSIRIYVFVSLRANVNIWCDIETRISHDCNKLNILLS